MIFSKAKTLVNLRNKLNKFIIPNTLVISVRDWIEDEEKQSHKIKIFI